MIHANNVYEILILKLSFRDVCWIWHFRYHLHFWLFCIFKIRNYFSLDYNGVLLATLLHWYNFGSGMHANHNVILLVSLCLKYSMYISLLFWKGLTAWFHSTENITLLPGLWFFFGSRFSVSAYENACYNQLPNSLRHDKLDCHIINWIYHIIMENRDLKSGNTSLEWINKV